MTKFKRSRWEVEAEINAHAWKDMGFKHQLMSNPKEALKKFGMRNIPENTNIRMIEEKPHEWCIVLHQAPPNARRIR